MARVWSPWQLMVSVTVLVAVVTRIHVNGIELPQNYAQMKNSENVLDCEAVEKFCPLGTEEKIARCAADLDEVVRMGYTWSRRVSAISGDAPYLMGDPLDNLDHICQLFSRFQDCIRLHKIIDYCLMLPPNPKLGLKVAFDFICNVAPRNFNTVHSLQCFKDTKLMSSFDLHLGKECLDGLATLNNQTRVYKRAFFYKLDIPAAFYKGINPPHILNSLCLPKLVVHGCVKEIVERTCGKLSTGVAVQFIEFQNKLFASALLQVGLSPVCDAGQMPQGVSVPTPTRTSFGNLTLRLHGLHDPGPELVKIASQESAGTALDTVFGRRLLQYVRKVHNSTNRCGLNLLYEHYQVCHFFSINTTEPPRYNILQSGHRILGNNLAFGTQCSRLQELVACWNVQKQVCGPATRGFEHDLILQIESCNIQQYMESIKCDWQGTMFQFYINASRHTDWPLGIQSGNPLYLDRVTCKLPEVIQSLQHFIYLLDAGIERIVSRCGQGAADRLLEVYRKLNYTMADAFILGTHIWPHVYVFN